MSSESSEEPCPESVITAAFLCGWSCADEAHFSMLPEALVSRLGIAFAEMKVVDTAGVTLHHQAQIPSECPSAVPETHAPCVAIEGPMNGDAVFSLAARKSPARELTPREIQLLRTIAELAQKAIACVLIRQHDRKTLGEPFSRLSQREWEVCRALEGAESEKEIAARFNCSVYTVHAHVKRIYMKLGINGRKQLVQMLRQARQKYRSFAAQRFGGAETAV